jgi:phosphomannomutase
VTIEEAIDRARSWILADPDPETRRELQLYIDDPARHPLLLEVMSGSLRFGTAGLRAIVGPGPMRMNRAVIRRTTAGVARYLQQRHGAQLRPVVVGADARHSSPSFLREALGVLAARGIPVRFFPAPVPTPLAAYVARRLQASACIVITASHNPAEYNGYKLYGEDAVQIVPPVDDAIAREIERSAPADREPSVSEAERGHPGVEPVAAELVDDYYRDVARSRPAGAPARDLRIAYTPLHGVGAPAIERVLGEAGFTELHVVPEQREPDGSFPTVEFPNPEEPGALDRVTALAQRVNAEIVLANDPDVDRLAVSLPDGGSGWLPLSGNQIGILLADATLERAAKTPRPLVVESIVSSPMLGSVAQAHGAHLERTLTGFKWIWTAALELTQALGLEFVFGFEEALGFSAGSLVRDKDGISAALLICELAAAERARGSSLRERLAGLYQRHGLWVSVQRSLTRHGLEGAREIEAAMERLGHDPPRRVLGAAISEVTDYRRGGERRPRWLPNSSLIELTLGARGRILVRPSGTEPKLKIYVDLCRPLGAGADVWRSEKDLRAEARALAEAAAIELGLG